MAKVDSLEAGDSVDALISPDYTNWTVVHTWDDGDSDDIYHFVDIDLSAYSMTSDFWVAFDSNMNSDSDRFYIDDLRFVGTVAYEVVSTAGDRTSRGILNVNNGNLDVANWQDVP